jgi:hypothetical protein
MTHKKNFVVAVKVNGKVLRESNDRVELPFGSEYSILLKNLDSVRMQARIYIDGTDAVDWVIINPNSSVEIERFLKVAGSLDKGNRFKFIEMTDKIEEHRGIKADDGLIRVEFKREKVFEFPKTVVHYHTYPYQNPWHERYPYGYTPNWNISTTASAAGGLITRSSHTTFSSSSASANPAPIVAMNMMSAQANVNDAGITVPGSISDQKFVSVQGFDTEQSEVVVLHLVGKKAGAPVQVAKTVHMMLQCETCGKTSKSSAKFCKECGTSLERV